MNVFVIGGLSGDEQGEEETRVQETLLAASMDRIGRQISLRGHNLLVCSPFAKSADISAIRGAASVLKNGDLHRIEIHHPDFPEVREEIVRLRAALGTQVIQSFSYPSLAEADESQSPSMYSWLLAQLSAMDRSQALIALGGHANRSASLLLAVAETRHKNVLPLTYLGGAAKESFARMRYQLQDRLGDKLAIVQDPERTDEVVEILEQVSGKRELLGQNAGTFFISYPRSRPHEADFAETVLRRRDLEVFRDERDFSAGKHLPGEIREQIYRATVFIAIWCREYACSPWCFDELQVALDRSESDSVQLWLLCVDETRIVPPAARNLVSYRSHSREELERHLLNLLDRK